MKLLLRLTLLILAALLALPPLAATHPVAAQTPDPNKYMEPGHYIGFVSLILHSDMIMPARDIGGGATATIEYEGLWIQRNGLLELQVDDDQTVWADLNLNPVDAVMEYFDYAKTPVGDCTWGATWRGEMRLDPKTMGQYDPSVNRFNFLTAFVGLRTLTFDLYKASGSLKGCDKRPSNMIWNSLLAASEFQSSQITEINLWIDSHPHPWTMNGTCTVRGWDKTESVAGGTLTRDTPLCKWNAWQSNSDWTWAVKKRGRK